MFQYRYMNLSTDIFMLLIRKSVNFCFRTVWAALVIGGSVAIFYFSLILQLKFTANIKATVVESTNFPIYEISYPAVTFCHYNRVNAERIQPAIEKYA